MKLASNILLDMTSGADRRTPEFGDAAPQMPNTILPVIETLAKGVIGITGAGLVADTSLNVSTLRAVPALAGATSATMVTLPKGLYTIDLIITARFVTSSVVGGVTPDIWIDIVNEALTVTSIMCSLYAVNLTQSTVQRRIRFAPQETVLIRARNAATIAAQTMDIHFSANVERHL